MHLIDMSSIFIYRLLDIVRRIFIIICRHRLFQAFYLILLFAGHGIIFFDIRPWLNLWEPNGSTLLWVSILFFINLSFFWLLSTSDPGVLTTSSLSRYQTYSFDNMMYKEKTLCPTCKILKPARSKHSGQ